MTVWQEWEPDPELDAEGPAPLLWCHGWTPTKDGLAQAFYRFGFAPELGAAWQLAEMTDLRYTYLCTEDGEGDERTFFECARDGSDPRPVTFAIVTDTSH